MLAPNCSVTTKPTQYPNAANSHASYLVLLDWCQHKLVSPSIARQCSHAQLAPLGRAAQVRPRSGSREMKPMRCTHACQCLCAQAFTAMTFYTLQPNFHGKSYFFTTFDRKNIFNDFRKFKSFRAQRGAKFFRFSPKIIGFSMIFAIIN